MKKKLAQGNVTWLETNYSQDIKIQGRYCSDMNSSEKIRAQVVLDKANEIATMDRNSETVEGPSGARMFRLEETTIATLYGIVSYQEIHYTGKKARGLQHINSNRQQAEQHGLGTQVQTVFLAKFNSSIPNADADDNNS